MTFEVCFTVKHISVNRYAVSVNCIASGVVACLGAGVAVVAVDDINEAVFAALDDPHMIAHAVTLPVKENDVAG